MKLTLASRYLTEATALSYSRELTFLPPSWCTSSRIRLLTLWILKSTSFQSTMIYVLASMIIYLFKRHDFVGLGLIWGIYWFICILSQELTTIRIIRKLNSIGLLTPRFVEGFLKTYFSRPKFFKLFCWFSWTWTNKVLHHLEQTNWNDPLHTVFLELQSGWSPLIFLCYINHYLRTIHWLSHAMHVTIWNHTIQ